MMDNQADRFSQTRVQNELFGADNAEQIWNSFWEGEDGLKHGGYVGDCEVDDPDGLDFDGFEKVTYGVDVINAQTMSLRTSLKSFLDEIHDEGVEEVADYVESLKIAEEDNGIFFRGGSLDLDKIEELWVEEEGRDDLMRCTNGVRRDILKSITMTAIMDSCGSFRECCSLYEEWSKLENFRLFVSSLMFSAWLSKARGWEEKRIVLRELSRFNLSYSGEFIEALFAGCVGFESRKKTAKNLMEDEEFGRAYKNSGFFYSWAESVTTRKDKSEIMTMQANEYGMPLSIHNILGYVTNFDDFTEFGGSFSYFATHPQAKTIVLSIGFLNLLMNNDTFKFSEKLTIMEYFKNFGVTLDLDILEDLFDNEFNLMRMRAVLPGVKDLYKEKIDRRLSGKIAKKMLTLSCAKGVEEIVKTGQALRRSGFDYDETAIAALGWTPDVCEEFLSREDTKNLPCLRIRAILDIASDSFGEREPSEAMLSVVGELPDDKREALRSRLVSFFDKYDIDIDTEGKYYRIGESVSCSMDDADEVDLAPWLELYVRSQEMNAALYADLFKLAWENEVEVPEDLNTLFRGTGTKEFAEILSSLEEYFSDDDRPDIKDIEYPDWQALFKYLRRKSVKKKKTKKKKKGRR